MKMITRIYIAIASYLGMLVWAIIGLIVWIPLLIVGTSTYFFEVVKATISNSELNEDAEIRLKNKIDMYARGFRNFELVIKLSASRDNN